MRAHLGEVSLPLAYRDAADVLALAEAGIPPSEAEGMDPRLLAGVADLLAARLVAVDQRAREAGRGGK